MFKDRYILDLREGGRDARLESKRKPQRMLSSKEEGQRRSKGLPAAPTQHQEAAGRHYLGREPAGEAVVAVWKADLTPQPGLKSLCCGGFMVTGRSVDRKKGGHG